MNKFWFLIILLFPVILYAQKLQYTRNGEPNENVIVLGVVNIETPFVVLETDSDLLYVSKMVNYPYDQMILLCDSNNISIKDNSITLSDFSFLKVVMFPNFIHEFVIPNINDKFFQDLLEKTYPNFVINPLPSILQDLKWKTLGKWEFAKILHKQFLIVLLKSDLIMKYDQNIEHEGPLDKDSVVNKINTLTKLSQGIYFKCAIPISDINLTH